jgi:DNA sulfur modification protein DndD
MILETLQVKNFRQYYKEQKIEFCSGSQNVTVIRGTTGAGKTNLFTAINWCLYGVESGLGDQGEIINKKALAEAKKGARVDAEVELRFRHLDSDNTEHSYVAVRSTRDSLLRLSRVTKKGLEELPNPNLMLNTILPKDVRTYFFFDGEKIDDFAKPEHEAQIKDAVYSVLQLEVLERSKTHLNAVADEYERELKKLDTGGVLEELTADKEQKISEKTTAEEQLGRDRHELNSASEFIDDIDRELGKQREVQDDVKQRQHLESERNRIEEDLEALYQNLRDIGSSGYSLLGLNALAKATEIINKKRQRGEIPAGIREQFVRDLLEKATCICGRGISAEGPERQTLLALLGRSMPSTIEDKILETGGLLLALRAKAEQRLQALLDQKKLKVELDDALNRVTKEADDIGVRLKGVGIQQIEVLEDKRRAAQRKTNELSVSIGRLEQSIRDLEREIKDLNHRIEKAEGLEGKAQLVQKKLSLARQAAEAVAEVHEKFAQVMRKRIEEETKKIFSMLVWKESQFTNVELTEDYHLIVLDRWGSPARPELSAGERQLLSLSFIIALSRVSEGSAPIVMDTPFGRLDTQPRENICEHIPEMVHQVVLLVTGEELHGKALEILKPRIGKAYHLDWEKSTGCTVVVSTEGAI